MCTIFISTNTVECFKPNFTVLSLIENNDIWNATVKMFKDELIAIFHTSILLHTFIFKLNGQTNISFYMYNYETHK